MQGHCWWQRLERAEGRLSRVELEQPAVEREREHWACRDSNY